MVLRSLPQHSTASQADLPRSFPSGHQPLNTPHKKDISLHSHSSGLAVLYSESPPKNNKKNYRVSRKHAHEWVVHLVIVWEGRSSIFQPKPVITKTLQLSHDLICGKVNAIRLRLGPTIKVPPLPHINQGHPIARQLGSSAPRQPGSSVRLRTIYISKIPGQANMPWVGAGDDLLISGAISIDCEWDRLSIKFFDFPAAALNHQSRTPARSSVLALFPLLANIRSYDNILPSIPFYQYGYECWYSRAQSGYCGIWAIRWPCELEIRESPDARYQDWWVTCSYCCHRGVPHWYGLWYFSTGTVALSKNIRTWRWVSQIREKKFEKRNCLL